MAGWICIAVVVVLVVIAVAYLAALGVQLAIRLAARLWRRWSGGPGAEQWATVRYCPHCGDRLYSSPPTCLSCGWSRGWVSEVELLSDLAATARQLGRFRRSGAIESSAADALRAAIDGQRRRLTGLEPTAAEPGRPGEAAAADAAAARRPPAEPVAAGEAEEAARPGPRPSARPVPPPLPREPVAAARPARRAVADVLAVFMEERNIRWGELVGGMLIVLCSAALVISLWSQIAAIPILKFVIFSTVNAALLGVGLYTEHRWKLPTTSRGLLIIATLLVPLNFLAMAAFSEGVSAGSVAGLAGQLGGELMAVALFAVLVYQAGRVVCPDGPAALALGVVACSGLQLLVRRFAGPQMPTVQAMSLGSLPLLCYWAVTGMALRQARRRGRFEAPEVNGLFVIFGLVSFAAALPLGLLLFKTGDVTGTLRRLSPLASLYGVPAMAVGLVLWRRAAAAELAMIRMVGTSVGVAGAFLLVGGLGLAWPDPANMLPAALLDFAVLSICAWAFEIPAAHLLAGPAVAVAWLLVLHLAAGHVDWWMADGSKMLRQLASGYSGRALVPLCVAFAGVAEWLRGRCRPADAACYAAVAGGVAVVSLALVGLTGLGRPGDPQWATWVFGFYAAGAFWVGQRLRRAAGIWLGSGLMLVAFVQGLVYWLADYRLGHPWQLAMLGHATAAVVGAVVARYVGRWRAVAGRAATDGGNGRAVGLYLVPLTLWAAATSVVAAWLILTHLSVDEAGLASVRSLWLAAVWLAVAWLSVEPAVFTVCQVAVAAAVSLAVIYLVRGRAWFTASAHPLLDPWQLQAQGVALGLLSLVWGCMRLALRRVGVVPGGGGQGPGMFDRLLAGWPLGRPARMADADSGATGRWAPGRWPVTAARLLYPPWPAFDRVVIAVLLAVLVGLALYGAVPGMVDELSWPGGPSRSESAAVPVGHAFGPGAWALWAAILAALAVGQWERFEPAAVFGGLVLLVVGCLLGAGRWQGQLSVASAFRWYAAAALLAGSIPIWFRGAVQGLAVRLGWPQVCQRYTGLARGALATLLCLTAGPILVLTMCAAGRRLAELPVAGPAAGSLFDRMGPAASYAVPLVAVSVALVGYAVRERAGRFALAAGLVLNLTVTLGYALSVVTAGGAFSGVEWVRLAQWNGLAAGLFASAWMGAVYLAKGWRPGGLIVAADGCLLMQVAVAVGLNAVLIGVMACWLFVVPSWPGGEIAESGTVLGWLAAGAAGLAMWLRSGGRRAELLAGLALVGLAAGCLAAFTCADFDYGTWLAYHTLLVAWCAVAWLPVAVVAWDSWFDMGLLPAGPGQSESGPGRPLPARISRWLEQVSRKLAGLGGVRWSTAVGVVALVMALRALGGDPQHPWWSLGGVGSVALLALAVAWLAGRFGYLYWWGLLGCVATSIWWLEYWQSSSQVPLLEWAEANCVAVALCGIAGLAVRLQWQGVGGATAAWPVSGAEAGLRTGPPRRSAVAAAVPRVGRLPAFHLVAALACIAVLSLAVAARLAADVHGKPMRDQPLWGYAALLATAALMVVCLWDRRGCYGLVGLYALGLVGMGMWLDRLDLPGRWLAWIGLIHLSAYAVATSYGWRMRERLGELAAGLKIPPGDGSAAATWLLGANGVLAVVVTALGYWVVLTFSAESLGLPGLEDWLWRVLAAKAVLAQGLAIGLLAHGPGRLRRQQFALWLVVAGSIAWGWAMLEPGASGNLLNRAVMAMTVLAVATGVYGVGLVKLLRGVRDWTVAAQRLAPSLMALTAGCLLFVLGAEVVQQLDLGVVSMSWPALVTVAAALAGLSVTGLVFAVVPGRDPLSLPERRRTAYVYASEALLALLFMHIRLTMPWLFSGWFLQYWPLVVMGIAFAGVGGSEVFRRQGRRVLAEPLERTGALLPLLPVLGFWMLKSQLHYSAQLFLVGLFYGVLSVSRRSLGYGVLAALAGNGGLWYLLGHASGLGLLEHPQLWLIPPAVSVLAAAQLNRDRLRPEQMTSLRYVCLMAIYVSSTADIFIAGVAESPWLPLVLAGLSVLGVLAGMMLRVRAYLFLGSGFLLLSLVTMIWHAQLRTGWTWLWYVAGVGLGLAIIGVFGLFEKKRNELLRVLEAMKDWGG